ncbi:MAG TPA: DUF1571 domain-containing protein [Candidatus Deferrimicrobiaceae bacterium]
MPGNGSLRRFCALVALSLALLAALPPADAASSTPGIAETLVRAKAAWARVDDYACELHRQERHGDRLYRQKGVKVLFRKPYAIRMKWTEGEIAGMEALYVRGKHGGKMLVHSGGFFGFLTLRLDPAEPRAMKLNRHPITESGLGDLLDMIVRNHDRSVAAGEGTWRYGGEDDLGGRRTAIFSASLPAGKDYYAKGLIVNFDLETGLPIRVAAYGDDGLLLEEYWFDGLRLNVGLTDRDFEP